MKTVFSSNSQLCHVWAQQTQSNGRTKNMFFQGDRIYSYGTHYLAARIHDTPKGKIVLINEGNYSKSTARHLSHIRSAVNSRIFRVPNPELMADQNNIDFYKNEIETVISRSLKSVKITSVPQIKWQLKHLDQYITTANRFFKLVGAPHYKPSQEKINEVIAHLKKRLARYKELNSPEIIQKREAEKQEKVLKLEEKVKEQLSWAIAEFRQGMPINSILRNNLQFDLLRIQGNEVITSGGARVPLEDAKRMMTIINNTTQLALFIVGGSIGHFRIESVTEMKDDAVIKIGCHKILLSEAKAVLGHLI